MLSIDISEAPVECNALLFNHKLLLSFTGGRFGNRLRYAAVVVNTSLTGETLKYQEGIKVYQNWEDFIKIEVRQNIH